MKDKKSLRTREGESDRIRVYVRVRPRTAEEARRREDPGVESDNFEVSLNDARERRYRFDRIFSGQTTNREVYNTVGRPLLDAVFSGFNGTLMAYGQTGTGKTHTLMSKDGICALVAEKLFKRIHSDKHHDYKVCMSYLQIYQEKIYDLLNANSKLELVLREDPTRGVYVDNLSEYVVRDTAEVLSLLKQGRKKLIFAETRMNRVSSRSHSVCQITVERTRAKDGNKAGAEGFSSESSLLSPSSAMRPPSRKGVRSTGSLDRLREETKPRDFSAPLKKTSAKQQSFIPHRTSTPASKRSLSRNNDYRHSFHLSSLPEMTVTPDRPNRWSIGDMTSSLTGLGGSLPFSSSASQGSDLQRSMESELESSTESEGWPSTPSSPDIPEYSLGEEDDDDDESFLEGIRIRDDVLIAGRINICDLAGSERVKKAGVEGERLAELQHVNLSLLELGNTIHALSEGKRTHIPYRNSSLTRLLQDSLGGNCKTSFVMCISPSLRDVNETRCTLDFGQRALKITTTAYVNIEIDYRKLSEDLRKRIECQELEIKVQKDNFEKQSNAIKSDAELKLAEVQTLLETERDRFRIEIENLRKEKENLAKTLFDERSQRRVLEGMHHASLEAAVLIERQKIKSNEEREKQRLQRALDEERRRSWTIEQQTKQEYERALEDEKKRTKLLKELEREGLEKSLQEEKQRSRELEERLVKSPSHERYTQTIAMFDEPDFPRMPPGTNQTETLYNVLLAEIMSLQLLYQMQDLSHACNADDPKSRDSGCAEYEEEVIHSVSSSVLEKGGLLLNNLRGRQGGASRFSLTSTDSLRELYLLQFPPSPKLSRASQKTESVPIIPSKGSLSELHSDSNKSFMSTDCDGPRGQDGTSSSSMESFLEEPLSPRCRRRPCDSGCSSQHSDSDHSPGAGIRSRPIDVAGRTRALSNPVNRLNVSAYVPLAEGEDEDFDLAEPDEIQTVKKRVDHLENDLCRLKTELDAETVNFFSEVFRVEVPFLREGELSRVMRRLFEGVKEKLLYRICAGQRSPVEEEEDELDLSPPVLEEAVNLLLVSKTVMSCLLVLQNRRNTGKSHNSTTTELPTVIHVPSKANKKTQTSPGPNRSLRRIRKDVSVGTDLPAKIQLSDKECQTSLQEISDRVLAINSPPKDEVLQVNPNLEAWSDFPDSNAHRTSQDSIPPQSRDPDGASSEGEPAIIDENREEVALESRYEGVMSYSEDDDLRETKGKKKKKTRLFSCLSPPRLSFRKKSEKANRSKQETTKLVMKEV